MRVKTTATKLTLLGLGLGLVGVVAAASVAAGDIYVIVHPSVNLAEDEIRQVYLGEKQFVGALKLVPVDNAVVQNDFLERVIFMSADKYSALWIKKSFRGDATVPKTKPGDAEVIRFVKSTPGAVGYLSEPSDEVKALYQY